MVNVYVEQGWSVEAGVKVSESPLAFHVPATAGVSIGLGESDAGGADRRTTSCADPLEIAPEGRPVKRVGGAGLVGVAGVAGVVVVVGVLGVVWPAGVLGVLWLAGAVVAVALCVATSALAVAMLASVALGPAIAVSAQVNVRSLLGVTVLKSSQLGGGRLRLYLL
jgi:hypothetical protein